MFGGDYPTPDGTAVRDYVHVTDVAAAHVAALEALDGVGRPLSTWNVGSGRPTSVLSLVGTFEAATGRTLPYRVLPRRNPEGYPLAETPETPWRGGVGHRLRLLQGAENGPFW